MPCHLAEAVTLGSTAADLSPPSPPRRSQRFRLVARRRMGCSAGPLSIVSLPSVRKMPRVGHWFEAYVPASPTGDFGSSQGPVLRSSPLCRCDQTAYNSRGVIVQNPRRKPKSGEVLYV